MVQYYNSVLLICIVYNVTKGNCRKSSLEGKRASTVTPPQQEHLNCCAHFMSSFKMNAV